MGVVRALHKEDSHDGELFFIFKKAYEDAQAELIQALIQGDKRYILQTATGDDIYCTLQTFYGSDFTTHPYGPHYHILLERDDKRYGCNIEHRVHPYQEARFLNASSFVVHNQKYGFLHQNTHDKEESQGENSDSMSA